MTIKILAIIVSYNSVDTLKECVNALLSENLNILIIDNGSVEIEKKEWDVFKENLKINVIVLDKNYGIAHALNIGVKYAQENEYNWVLTMDQDSQVRAGFVDAYIKYIKKNPQALSLTPKFTKSRLFKNGDIVDLPISSGNLVNIKVYELVGIYEKEYFIDFVDFEFSLRAKLSGINTYFVETAELVHQLGGVSNYYHGLSKYYTNHNPLRRYYKYRNLHYLVRQYYVNFPYLCTKLLISNYFQIIIIALLDKQRLKALRSIFMGFLDFINGVKGDANK